MNHFLSLSLTLALLPVPTVSRAEDAFRPRDAVRLRDAAAHGAASQVAVVAAETAAAIGFAANSPIAGTLTEIRAVSQKRPKSPSKKKKKAASASTTAKQSKPPTFVWPIADRKILHKYGDRTNPTTNTVTVNPGIDIASKKGTDVRSAAAGTVSLVSWLPSYGTFVIVEHANEYRSVYANLASTSVEKGEVLKAGEKVGAVGASKGGAFLHFEIWRDTTRLDPARHLPPAKRK